MHSFFSIFLCILTTFLITNAYPFHQSSTHRSSRARCRKSIMVFEGQRLGNQRISWRKDPAINVDLEGGYYYDAEDNVKFGIPMAFTTTMLSWSVLSSGGLMKYELENAKEAVRWASDYLLNAAVHPDTIYVQAGNAQEEHARWERPEDMDTSRNVYKIDKNNPGTEVAAETAAALAAASMVFRRSDPAYSRILLSRATRVFQFAHTYRGSYCDGLKDVVCPFYCSYSGFEDELLWGATWLHRATGNTMYLSYIQRNGQVLDASEEDFTFKHVGARILVSKSFMVPRMQALKTYSKYLKASRMTDSCGDTVVTPRTIAKKQGRRQLWATIPVNRTKDRARENHTALILGVDGAVLFSLFVGLLVWLYRQGYRLGIFQLVETPQT